MFYKNGHNIYSKLKKHTWKQTKQVVNYLISGRSKKVIFIVGCQRSGTTMLQNVFSNDWRTRIFSERNKITNKRKNSLRLKNETKLSKSLENISSSLLILKPLAETQSINEYNERISNSHVLFLYRNYKDVANSYVKAFNGVVSKDVKSILNINPSKKWLYESLEKSSRNVIRKYHQNDINNYEKACLVWCARNIAFLHQNIASRADTLMLKYENFVNDPEESIQQIYEFLNVRPPCYRITKGVYSKSIGKGESIDISKDIERLCEEILQLMDKKKVTNRNS